MLKSANPLIVQSDRTLLLDVHAPLAEECRSALIPFAELVRSPEHLHTYQISSLSLWNAASSGFTSDQAIETLEKFSRYEIPEIVLIWIKDTADKFGKLRLIQGPSVITEKGIKEEYLYLVIQTSFIYKQIEKNAFIRKYLTPSKCEPEYAIGLTEDEKDFCFKLLLTDRGTVKQILLDMSFPVKDDVPLIDGEPLEINLREKTSSGKDFIIREYQKNAAEALVGNKGPGTGFGTIVLPCGAGKTIVGMKIMSLLKTNTLIVTTNITAVHQWIDELLDKTNLTKDQIAEYTGENKTIKPITVATYQILTWRPDKTGPYPHFALFRQNNWGLIIYDEVHTLPAPVFRVVADLQAIRRVGLTATLVREDGCEGHVFSLVGPKRYDVPWKDLEKAKWIATAECIEVRVPLLESNEVEYAISKLRDKHRIASENSLKTKVVQELVTKFDNDKILIIGQYLSQLNVISKLLEVPIITGKTKNCDRDKIYADFRAGKIRVLVVSKVANFSIDLPDASIAIQVSGTFGSRQEEAQRVGRILRPKEKIARFFTLITKDTVEEDFGGNRQKFLAEQGYSYRIIRYENENSFDELDIPLQIEGCGI